MKILFLAFLSFVNTISLASNTACTSYNTQTRIARETVKSLISLAAVPVVDSYYGGVESDQNGLVTVNVQPHFNLTKDWYKVTIRSSDCRVINAVLFQEGLPIK